MKKFTIACLLSMGLLWQAQPSLAQYERIELIGTSVPTYDWMLGVEMNTTDGENYSLLNYYLPPGMLKFRKYQDWAINWGNIAFPSGTGTPGGSNIAIPEGTYNIYFNRTTGAYNFACVTDCNPTPSIGILGGAVPPDYWSGNVLMHTTDGIIYQLTYTLAAGALQFIQDNNNNIRFGGLDFPTGYASAFYNIAIESPGDYEITYNRITGAYSFVCTACAYPSIGIIGTSVSGWDNDVDMTTTDGIHYSLLNYHLTAGEVKFRQNDSWNVNWGTYWGYAQFPEGDAVRFGANIPVTAGRYNIYFERDNSRYRFTAACEDPVIACPADISTSNDPSVCSAVVSFDPPAVTDPCGTAVLTQTAGIASGEAFPAGSTTNIFMVESPGGFKATCSFKVTVNDTEAPVISGLNATPAVLWPPNHKMRDVLLAYSVTDNCGVASVEVTVSSNEPLNGTGDGDTAPDWQIFDNNHLQLRAERAAKGTGRVYTITVVATDHSGNTRSASITVTVPKSMAVSVRNGWIGSGNDGQPDVRVMPNPSSRVFSLQAVSSLPDPVTIRISDASGRVLTTHKVQPGQWLQTGERLQPGIYVAELIQGPQRKTVRLIKQ